MDAASDGRAGAARVKPRILSGFRDFLPRQMLLRQRIIGIIREVFERHGFEPLDTPALEHLDVLTGKAGENEKLMYHFADHGGREVGLRYDLTVPLARVVAMHQNDLVFPFKRYHIAPVWRGEHAQRGRFREFWQCDADIAGSPSMLADAEIIAVLTEALSAIGLPSATVRVSHRKLLAALGRAAGVPNEQAGVLYRSIDRLDKVGRSGVARELAEAGLPNETTDRILDLVAAPGGDPRGVLADLRSTLKDDAAGSEALADLDQLFSYLPDFGVPPAVYRLDFALARGLDYYTGPVYEAWVEEPKIGSVAGAGRYDGLVGTFSGRPIPATGMSLGLERIIEVVEEFDLLPGTATVADVLVTVFPDTVGASARIAGQLREAGLRVDLSLQPNRGLGEQLKYADRKGIPLAVIAGSAELAAGQAAIKSLRTQTQQTYPLDGLAAAARDLLAVAGDT